MTTTDQKEIILPSFLKAGFKFRIANYATATVTVVSVKHNNIGITVAPDKHTQSVRVENWDLRDTIAKFGAGIFKITLPVVPKKKGK